MKPFWWVLGTLVVIVTLLIIRQWRRLSLGKRLRFEVGSLYYAGLVTADEAERAGRYLRDRGYFQPKLTMVRLFRDGTTYQLQLLSPVNGTTETQSLACEILAAGLADEVLPGANVEVQVCDWDLRPILTIPHRGRLGCRMRMNAACLFYTDGVTEDVANSVALFLAHMGIFNDSAKVAQLDRTDEGFEMRLAVEVDPLTPEMIEGQRRMAYDLTHKVLGGKPVEVRYCHGLAGTMRVDRADPEAAPPRGQMYASKVFVRRGDADSPAPT
ncbi:MAG TPA: hypothetical protein VHC22_17795 [Pirellulales bacterium]|nr:hypothetical protein [Pirellulales bacterium]